MRRILFSFLLLASFDSAAHAQALSQVEATAAHEMKSAPQASKQKSPLSPTTPPGSPPTTKLTPTPFQPYPDIRSDKCYADSSHDRADLCAQWRAALAAERAARNANTANWLAGFSLLVGLVGFIALLDNLRQMRRANKLTEGAISDSREIGEAQARCYLALERLLVYIGEDSKPRLSITMRNCGASPALDLSFTTVLSYQVNAQAAARTSAIVAAQDFRVSIAPGTNMKLPDVTLEFPVNAEERATLLALSGKMEVNLSIEFQCKDIFNKLVTFYVCARGELHETERWSAMAITGYERSQRTRNA